MKPHLSFRILIGCKLLISCLLIPAPACLAGSVIVDSSFTNSTVLFPFGISSPCYGLSFSGKVSLFSDTSLVRIILIDSLNNEYLLQESYVHICDSATTDYLEYCLETCYLPLVIPHHLRIIIQDASVTVDSLIMYTTFDSDFALKKDSLKYIRDSIHITAINDFIQ